MVDIVSILCIIGYYGFFIRLVNYLAEYLFLLFGPLRCKATYRQDVIVPPFTFKSVPTLVVFMFADSRKLWVALGVTLLASMGISLPYPVLTPLFIDAPSNALNTWGGFQGSTLYTALIAIYPLGIFLGSSFIGALSDRLGRKKVLAQTLLICFLGYLVSAYALYSENYLLLLLSRFFTGITEGNVAIARAIALDIGQGKEGEVGISKVKAVSFINSAVFLGWLLGPLIGGILANIAAYYSMLAAAVGALLCYYLTIAWLQESTEVQPSTESLWRTAIKENSLQLVKDPWVARLFVMYLSYTLAINLFYEFYPVWLVDKQSFDSLAIGLSTTNMTIFMTLASLFLVTRINAKFGLTQPMVNLMWMLALAMFLIPFTDGISTQVMFALTGVIIASFNGLMPVYVSDKQQGKGNGAVMGLLTMTFCIANVIAAVIGGPLLLVDASWPLYVSAGFFLVAMVLFWQWFARTESQLDKANDLPS